MQGVARGAGGCSATSISNAFLASQDALEVMRVTYSLTESLSH